MKSNLSWSRFAASIGLCTVLIGAVNLVQGKPPEAFAQTTTRTSGTFTGRISSNSSVLQGGNYYVLHNFIGTAGETLTFDLVSDDFDAYLLLVSPSGETIAQNDDGAGGTNARIIQNLPVTGNYLLIVTSYSAGETGTYQLQVRATTEGDRALTRADRLSQQVAELYQAERYSEAIPIAEEAVAIYREQLGDNHPNVALSLNSLALVYEGQGRYGEAESLFLEALAIRRQQLDSNHYETAHTLNNLALLYQDQGRYDEAEPLFLESLEIYREQLGDNHFLVAIPLNNLAIFYQDQGRYDEAEPLFLEALAIRRRQLGNNHPDVALSLNNLAALYEAQGRDEEAETLSQEALNILNQ
jgi:tetratricopeptide (TPR) repeat protein